MINENNNLEFDDFGKIDWFDSSKGYGVINTFKNNNVFLHKTNINKIPNKGDRVIIYKIWNNKYKERIEGIKVILWEKSFDDFCELIFNRWILIQDQIFNKELKWILFNSPFKYVKEIIIENIDKWIDDEELINFLKRNITKFDSEKRYFISNFFFEKWKRSRKYNECENLIIAFNDGYRFDIINEAIKIDFSWIYDSEISTFLRSLIKYSSFDDSSYNQSKVIFYNFILERIQNQKNIIFNKDIEWLIKNGDDSVFPEILNLKSLFIEENFINCVRKNIYTGDYIDQPISFEDKLWMKSNNRFFKHKHVTTYSIENTSKLLFEIWKSNQSYKFNEDVKWIIINGSENVTSEIFNKYGDILLKDKNFISFLYSTSVTFPRNYENSVHFSELINNKIRIPDTKIELIKQVIYNYWLSTNKIFDENIEWLIFNTDIDFLKDCLYKNLKIWCSNKEIFNFIYKIRFENDTFKEIYSYEVCLVDKYLKNEIAYNWLLEKGYFDKIMNIIEIKLGYSKQFIENMYRANYPNGNINYYSQKANSSDWSFGFKERYISERKEEIEKRFAKLFLDEIQQKGSQIKIKESKIKVTHSATDLSNFVFCPASYYINQTIEVDFSEQENIFIGNLEHNKTRVLSINNFIKKSYKINFSTDGYNNILNRIINANCISTGHNESKPTIYYSKKKKLSGIPDYIFKDSKGYFVVEEKYTFNEYSKLDFLYENHKVQVLAYLYGLDEFQFTDAYIVYWYIKKKHDESEELFEVYNFRIFHIVKTDNNKLELIRVFDNLEKIQNRNAFILNNSINHNKCVKCNYFPYCEFKNGNKRQFILPEVNI